MDNGKNGRKIKICGLTRDQDIDYVNEAMPDYIGFVFAKSERQIQGEKAKRLRQKLRAGIRAVGVFVDAPMDEMVSLVQGGTIDMVQLHGGETPALVEELKERTDGCKIIKALRPEEGCQEGDVYEAYRKAGVDFFLFDSGGRAGSGGTGRAFRWDLIPKISYPYFLAGGICAENVEEAMALADPAPFGLDISSGVETNGVKDREKILEIIRRIRNV